MAVTPRTVAATVIATIATSTRGDLSSPCDGERLLVLSTSSDLAGLSRRLHRAEPVSAMAGPPLKVIAL
jgi:hypothetical protein